jgi:hypothetical protein
MEMGAIYSPYLCKKDGRYKLNAVYPKLVTNQFDHIKKVVLLRGLENNNLKMA